MCRKLASVSADHGTELELAIEALCLNTLKCKVVTTDALHCNRRTVAAINAGGGIWCLALMASQGSPPSDTRACFGEVNDGHPSAVTENASHRRNEIRKAVVVSVNALAEHHEFSALKAFGRVEATRETTGTMTSETRNFALSWMPAPDVLLDVLLATARAHSVIENAMHWLLDVSFREDAERNRNENGAANNAVRRCSALDFTRRDMSSVSLSIKLKQAGWYDDFFRRILRGLAAE